MAVSEVERRRDVTRGTLIFIAVLLGAFALKLTSPLTAPLAFAFFAALVLQPLRARIARRMPRRLRWVGLFAAAMLLIVALAALGGAIGLAIAQAAEELPKHADRLGSVLQPLRSWAEQHGIKMGGGGGESGVPGAAQGGAAALRAVSGAIGFVVLSVFFVVLMLSEVGEWRKKLVRVLHPERAQRVLDAAAASESSVRRYLLAVTVVGFITAILEGSFMLVMGVKLALVWAVLFFLLNYIPYVGSLMAAVPPVLFVLATQGLQKGLVVAIGIAAIEQVMGNLVAPLVEGKGTKLSPLVVLAGVTFWGWAWGAVGALLAVPMTVSLMMLCARIPALERVAVLLGGDADQTT